MRGGWNRRRIATAWTALSVVGWLLVAAAWAGNEAHCDEATSLLCFKPRQIWLVTGVGAVTIWFAGLVIAAAAALHRAWKNSGRHADL